MTAGQWVIYAPNRKKRPHDHPNQDGDRPENLPERDEECPFCPGNEHRLSRIIMELPGGSIGNTWQSRVVPNKFPALTPDRGTERRREGFYLTMPGFGHHEVVIESPYHNRDISRMAVEEVETVVETYHRRYLDLMREHGNMTAIIFRNHGRKAGSSLVHPHSQIVVTGIVPGRIRRCENEAQRYYDTWGRCVICDIAAREAFEEKRIVSRNGSFVSFVPFASEVPFEIWIVPERHQADFGSIGDREKGDLARILLDNLTRIRTALQDPDYNYVIHTHARFRTGEPQLHWYLRIMPRLTTPAGFEIGSGIPINPSLPEEDARQLREARPD